MYNVRWIGFHVNVISDIIIINKQKTPTLKETSWQTKKGPRERPRESQDLDDQSEPLKYKRDWAYNMVCSVDDIYRNTSIHVQVL